MSLHVRKVKICRSCNRNVDNLIGKFVDPVNPVKECPHCGKSVHNVRYGRVFIFKK